MPPTGRRRARNKDTDNQRAEADVPETNTPSRKRRRVNGSDKANPTTATSRPGRRVSAETDETIDNQDLEDNEMDVPPEYREAEKIIQRLRVATYDIGAANDFHNSIIPQNVQAFAKIAGRNWTYYVRGLNVIIGRPNNKPKHEPVEEVSTDPAAEAPVSKEANQVDIDLGPDQQISRIHAQITYDTEEQEWFIHVNGRNGLTMDDTRLDRGTNAILRSGSVLNVLGTQMIFLLPDKPPVIHEAIRRMLLIDGDEEDESNLPEDKSSQGTNRRIGGRASGAHQGNTLSRGGAPQSGTQAAHALAALSNSQNSPGTPNPRILPPLPKPKNSPAYSRGLMLESTEEIDYSADSAKDMKPPHSYAQMIGQAILSRGEENATLAQIYEFIKDRYAFFRWGGGGWQNSIRHNLSLSKHFEKIPRRTDEPGKGMKWQIVPDFREEYMKKNFHENGRTQRRNGSSGPNSPALGMGTSAALTERLTGASHAMEGSLMRVKQGSRSPTPPNAYSAPVQTFTPDRGPKSIRVHTSQLPNGAGPVSATSDVLTPTFDRNQSTYSAGSRRGDGLQVSAIDSPPTLTGAAYDAAGGSNVFTPLPARHAPKHLIQSTVKPPSFYAKELFSSPAPFWRFTEFPGSTPLRPMPDLSPEKLLARRPTDDEEMKTDEVGPPAKEVVRKMEDNDEEDVKAEAGDLAEPYVPPPSSPPLNKASEELMDESPSRTVSRPVSRKELSGHAPPMMKGLDTNVPDFAPPPAQPRFGVGATALPDFKLYNRDAVMNGEAMDEDEEEGIDLSKSGFQKIGSFHQAMQATTR